MSALRRKPRINALLVKALRVVDRYVVEHNLRGLRILPACSDCWDGWLTRREVDPLVRQRLIVIIPLARNERSGNGLLGDRVTVEFTEAAARHFWPARRR